MPAPLPAPVAAARAHSASAGTAGTATSRTTRRRKRERPYVLGHGRRVTTTSPAFSVDLVALSMGDLRALTSWLCRELDRVAATDIDDPADVAALRIRHHEVATELRLRELSVAPGRPAIWAV
ncbi:hypothetical protein V6N00_04010 [Tersicoccus sp. MR15.9]|uniref:hypothetical protein n=1 Tax=Tersicoccus mangrovi TaxID=3121635 RepID=UPI002FE6C23B